MAQPLNGSCFPLPHRTFFKLEAQGFLPWGYNFWYKLDTEQTIDPFNEASATAYPGPDGPYDSIRWEVFAEALQDYAISQSVGINPGSSLLNDIKSYRDFSKQESWIKNTIEKRLE